MKVKIDEKANVLKVEIPISPRVSKSGKSNIVATSGGNQQTTATFNGKTITVGLNAYTAL